MRRRTNRGRERRRVSQLTCAAQRVLIRAAASTLMLDNMGFTRSIAVLKQFLQWVFLFGLIAGSVVAQRPADHAERFNPAGEYHPFNRPADNLDLQFHLRA